VSHKLNIAVELIYSNEFWIFSELSCETLAYGLRHDTIEELYC